MKRFWLGVGILVLFLTLSLWCAWMMKENHGALSDRLEEASRMALAGELTQAAAVAEQVHQGWDSAWKGTAALADHAPMEEIDGLFAQLKAYAEAGETQEFAAYSAKLARMLLAIGDAHAPSWWNFL